MSEEHADLRTEQERVTNVTGQIAERMKTLQARVSDIQTDIVGIRRDFWEDVTVNIEDTIEAAETLASIRQQAEVLSEQERSHKNAAEGLKTLSRLKSSPYFGRIDFQETGEKRADKVYLGISSFVDNDDNFLIHDWRAPISSLYYDYPPGPAKYTAPMGTIQGELELKRQYLIRGGKILSLFDTGVTIGDELLQEVLGSQSDNQMKSIVATIQQDQNRIIRDTRHRLLVVQGAAGSGKTSAALQRVAFLLYRFRESLTSDNIVLFSPNPLFASYVSSVLPELGEENMQQTTFQDYLWGPVGKSFELEDPFSQLEYILTERDDADYPTRLSGIEYKASLDFKDLIDQYVEALLRDGMIFRGLKFRGKLLISSKQLKKQFYSYHESISIPNRLQMLTEWALEELRIHETKERHERWVDEEIELLDTEVYAKAYNQLRKEKYFKGSTFNDFQKEKEVLAAYVVHENFKRLRRRIQQLKIVDVPRIYRQLFTVPTEVGRFTEMKSLPADWTDICSETVKRLDAGKLAYEDATPYVYLKERLEGRRTNTAIRHVFVDEAQDYSPFQFACIKRLFPHARMTVLGDVNQTIHVQAQVASGFNSLGALYASEDTETIVLTKSYRSTEPIVEFTSGILLGDAKIDPFHRLGPKPNLFEVADEEALQEAIVCTVADLQTRHKTIAIICKTAKEAKVAHERLKASLDVKLVTKATTHFDARILVIPAYLAKGVEFDAVVIYNASEDAYRMEHERKLFYTACTRAMHELRLFSVGTWTRFLSNVSPETYSAQNR